MPHRQPRDRHRCINDSLAGGPFTRAGHQRTYGGLDRAGVSPDGIPLLLHDSIDATGARAVRTAPFATTIVSGPPDEPAAPSARGAPTRYVHRAIPGPVPPGSLRASLSHPPVRASHQPRIAFYQHYPFFQDGRTVRGDWPEPLDVENEVSRPRRHRPEVLCGGADHDSGRDTLLRQGSRQPAVSARDGWRFPPSEVERGGTASSANGTLGPLRRDSLIGGRLRGPKRPWDS